MLNKFKEVLSTLGLSFITSLILWSRHRQKTNRGIGHLYKYTSSSYITTTTWSQRFNATVLLMLRMVSSSLALFLDEC
ncbi:MAG: hypothetical protein UU98_C0013G0044 [Parcubacteria group bacterium GW2011_GWD2_42_14]|nr:MAG: hypothetical protein UU98_C0013G0044 [Parcubacteria group bacterium GW2011_GWD2_42_14]